MATKVDEGKIDEERRLGLKEEVLERIRRRLERLTLLSGSIVLEQWFHAYKYDIPALAKILVDTSGSEEELEENVKRVIESFPRYVKLVRKVMNIWWPFQYVVWEAPEEAVRIFKSLAPLSSEPRETGLEIDGHPVYVGEWIQVHWYGVFVDIDRIVDDTRSLFKFIIEHGEEMAKYVEDEEKREVFLRLVELARRLFVDPSGVCAGEVSTYGYYPSIQRYVLYELSGRLCANDINPSYVRVGEDEILVLRPSALPTLIPIMDRVEELYSRLGDVVRRAVRRSRRVLEQMRRVASPYIVDKVLG